MFAKRAKNDNKYSRHKIQKFKKQLQKTKKGKTR